MESKKEVIDRRIQELMNTGKKNRPYMWDMNVITGTICDEFGEQYRVFTRTYILDYCNYFDLERQFYEGLTYDSKSV